MEKHVLESIDPAVIGERLAEARRARDLTQQQVADSLGVARTTVVAMEKGERRPRAAELVTLAQLYRRSVGELVRPVEPIARPDFVLQFRSAAGGADGRRERDIRRFEARCRSYVELEDWLGAPLPRRYPEEYDISSTPVERAAEEVASFERNRLGLGDAPIGDLWGMLETDVGLRLFAFPMDDSRIAGMFLYTDVYGGCIAVNANHPADRRRWNAAHEYAHFLTTRYRPEISLLPSSKRLPESERFADAFARHFLMPTAGIQRRFEAIRRPKNAPLTPADVLSLSHYYRVSFQAMTWRLEELKLLKAGTWETLKDLGFKPAAAPNLLSFDPHEEPELEHFTPRYVTLAIQAFDEGRLSEGQLAERLATDRVGARELIRRMTVQFQPSDTGDWTQISLDLTTPIGSSA